ncbi:hypothetical protein LCGC14_2410500, partial [marine sediment metagenome]
FVEDRPDAKEYRTMNPFNVLGFRLLKQVVTTTETTV